MPVIKKMITIIQLSDFHIKTSYGDPKNNTVFKDLVAFLQQFKKDDGKIIIVYNGDVIDNTNIYDQIKEMPEDTTPEMKEVFWEEKANEEYNLAVDYFRYMLDALKIPVKDLIICCGNHDVNSWYNTFETKMDCPYGKSFDYTIKRFDQYKTFLQKLNITPSFDTCFFTRYGVNFLVANSNWLNKYEHPHSLCINCKNISNKINEKKSIILDTIRKNKYRNVFVSHAPFSDYCEEAAYGYKKNEYSPITEIIEEYFGLQLFGDKHTGRSKGAEHIVGAPLEENRITYVIHQFITDELYTYRTLTFEAGKGWELSKTDKYLEKILNVSEKYIKEKAKEYLFASEYSSVLAAMNRFETIRTSSQWKALDKLFKTSSKLKKPKALSYPHEAAKEGSGKTIPISSDYISTLTRLIAKDDETRISLTVRGDVRHGKTVCMSILYLNMLYRFSHGTFDYIPFYIDIEKTLNELNKPEEDRDTKEYYEKVIESISSFLGEGRTLCGQYKYDACLIIDGLSQYGFYRKAKIDDGIVSLLSRNENKCFKKLVFCIDTYSNSSHMQMEHTAVQTRRDSQYLVYFDPILTYDTRAKERYDKFVEAYCELQSQNPETLDTIKNIVKTNITKMGILQIDTNLMTNCWEALKNTQCKDSYFSLLNNYIELKTDDITSNLAKANYLLSFCGKGYADIQKICKISNNHFDLLRTEPAIAKYLFAKHYIDIMSEYCDYQIDPEKEKITNDSCLNQLLNHEQSTLVREYIDLKNSTNIVLEFAEKYYSRLMPTGKANLSYLIGRLCNDENHNYICKLLSDQEKELDMIEKQSREEKKTINAYQRVARRSVMLSQMIISNNHADLEKAVLEYVHKLISNEQDRKINRRFHLQFYGDRKNAESSLNTDKIYEGFDMYCTYHILSQQFEEKLKHPDNHPLLSLELFTLCDLIQIRIDNPVAFLRDKDEKQIPSFFYNEKYNNPKDKMGFGIITRMNELVAKYLEPYDNNNDLFLDYLRHQQKKYTIILSLLEKGHLKEENRYNPEALLNELVLLEDTKRMGWMFKEKLKTIHYNSFIKKRNNNTYYETTLKHIYEMYIIGLLYLPKESDNPEYDKRVILDLVLLHDLGESHVGDSIKAYENYNDDKEKEEEWCKNLYLQGVHEGVADLTDYGKLWDMWLYESSNYNVKVAHDLDRLQLLYKLTVLLTSEDKKKAIAFSKPRFTDFWDLRREIQTDEVINIFNFLIANNQKFIDVVKAKYEINVKKLHSHIEVS